VNLKNDSNTGELKISGTLDIDAANSLREALLECLLLRPAVTPPVIEVDLSEVNGCDAAALQVLLAGRRDAAAAGKAFRVHASLAVTATAAALGFSIDQSRTGPEKERDDAG